MREPIGASSLVAALEREVAKGAAGFSAAIATRRGIVWSGVAGVANLSDGAPVDEAHLFGLGSITKTFVTVTLLQLAEEGKLSVEAKVPDHLDREVLSGIPNADVATLAQLMSHTGGVPSWEDDPVWIRHGRGERMDTRKIWGRAETLDYVRGPPHKPVNAPGAAFSYANTNYTLLGLVIERVAGQLAEAEIRRRILTPLGLRETYVEGFEPEMRMQIAPRYHYATADFRRDAGVSAAFPEVRPGLIDVSASNLSVEWVAGGMVSTARELATFALALRDARLLAPASLRFMQKWFPFPALSRGPGNAPADAAVGHGLFRWVRPGIGAMIGHGGDVLGSTAAFWWAERGDAVVAVLSNVGTMHAGRTPVHAKSVAMDSEFARLALRYALEHGVR